MKLVDNATHNPQQAQAFEFLQYTDKNVFLTGKAGTGKTTFLHSLKSRLPKRMIVVAPTGVAAINAGGVTIHSFFQMPFGPQLPLEPTQESIPGKGFSAGYLKLSREKVNIIRSLDLIVIDEISMVRADLLDGIDQVVRRFRRKDVPFGGVQLLMIGDLHQLSPVVKNDEWEILQQYYQTPYFFGSRALQKSGYISIELQHIYRQSDARFISVLNKIRENRIDRDTVDILNKRYVPGFSYNEQDGYITLTTHNHQAKRLNDEKLSQLRAKELSFTAEIDKDFPETSYPADYTLTLKVGAQVMFIKNDISPEKRFFNGKIGIVQSISDSSVLVKCKDETSAILVERMAWQNIRYRIDPHSHELVEEVIGEFRQFPLKCAWAITIHKSQGLTFEKVVIDSNAAFAHGQVYVALSRCKTLEGIVLQAPLAIRSIKTDDRVIEFTQSILDNPPGESILERSKRVFEKKLCCDLFDFDRIHKHLNYLNKLLEENSTVIQVETITAVKLLRNVFRQEIVDVAEKFAIRIEQLFMTECCVDENVPLQGYIQRACPYFLETLEKKVDDTLRSLYFTTDNKQVNKEIGKITTNLHDSIKEKTTVLSACKEQFAISTYLEARAKGSITTSDQKKPKPVISRGMESSQVAHCTHPELFSQLKEWRNQKAEDLDLPAYMVLPQKTLIQLSNEVPVTEAHLKNIHGIGKRKFESFGSELLEIIRKHTDDNGIEVTKSEEHGDKALSSRRIEKDKPTTQITFNMYKEGKSIEVIAQERGLAVSTIEGHLAFFVGKGELDITLFVPEPIVVLITECFSRLGTEKLAPVKAELGDTVSFGQLKLVHSFMEFQERTENRMFFVNTKD